MASNTGRVWVVKCSSEGGGGAGQNVGRMGVLPVRRRLDMRVCDLKAQHGPPQWSATSGQACPSPKMFAEGCLGCWFEPSNQGSRKRHPVLRCYWERDYTTLFDAEEAMHTHTALSHRSAPS